MNILIIDDEKTIRETSAMALEAEGHHAEGAFSGHVAMLKLQEERYDLAFLDLRLGDEDGMDYLKRIVAGYPKMPVVVFTAHASIETAVEAMKLGAFDYLEKPFTPQHLRQILSQAEKRRKMERKIHDLEDQVSSLAPPPDFAADTPEMNKVFDTLFRAAPTPASVLILGESGTGKTVVAREVHQRSHLKSGPFITVSCPSLSKELLESELFGHVKGSFTGALKDTWGKVAAAKGGTLFLDEIGELPMEIQPKLLRLLQERQYERLGENKTRMADVRIIAATNRDLKECVKEGTFREDLLYRLNVISVEMVPLRNRAADLKRLSEEYLEFFSNQVGRDIKGFSKEAWSLVLSYGWPGNIRELRNVLERAVILAKENEILPEDLPDDVHQKLASGIEVGMNITLEELEAEHLKRVTEQAPNLDAAARILGIDPATLYRKRKKLGLG